MQAAAGHQRVGGADIASSSRRGQPLPMPCPRTPPGHPDIHGKYRKQAELNRLTQEIALLEEELRSLESLPPASICCKECNYPLWQGSAICRDTLRSFTSIGWRSSKVLSIFKVSRVLVLLDVVQGGSQYQLYDVLHASILGVRAHSTSLWDYCFKECSNESKVSCCSCSLLKNCRCSCWKLPCKPCCTIPHFSCFKCSCFECSCFECSCPKCSRPKCSCFKCVKCCHPCGKK